MHIGFCEKCRYIDLLENMGAACPRCGGQLTPAGITTDEWNRLSEAQRDELIHDRFPTHEDLWGPEVKQAAVTKKDDTEDDSGAVTVDGMQYFSVNVKPEEPQEPDDYDYEVTESDVSEYEESGDEAVTSENVEEAAPFGGGMLALGEETGEDITDVLRGVIPEAPGSGPEESMEAGYTAGPEHEQGSGPELATETAPEPASEPVIIPKEEPDPGDLQYVYVCYRCNSIAAHDNDGGKYYCTDCGSDMVNVGLSVRRWADLSKEEKRNVTEGAKIMHMVTEIKRDNYDDGVSEQTPSIINVVKDPNSAY